MTRTFILQWICTHGACRTSDGLTPTGTRQSVTRSYGQLRWYAYTLPSYRTRAHPLPQILGVQALHRMRIIHRDLKPANVFLTSSRHIVIGDYGIAHAWLDPFYGNFPSSSLKARDAPGTLTYLAPEVVEGFYQDSVNVEVFKYANCGFETDIWSLAVTICASWRQCRGLFELEEGEMALDPKSAIPHKILMMDVQPAVERIVDGHPIWHLITRVSIHSLSRMDSGDNLFGGQMLDRNPKSRAGFKEILAHPTFDLLDWNRVANLDYTREFISLRRSIAVILISTFSHLEFPLGFGAAGAHRR